jgi:hypothetical protein
VAVTADDDRDRLALVLRLVGGLVAEVGGELIGRTPGAAFTAVSLEHDWLLGGGTSEGSMGTSKVGNLPPTRGSLCDQWGACDGRGTSSRSVTCFYHFLPYRPRGRAC